MGASQLTLIQHLLHTGNLSGQDTIPAALRTFPHTALIPESSTGAPPDWRSLTLWNP